MRALLFALILVAPLAAEEKTWLERAVAKFRSDDAAERDAATQAVRDHLKKELGPLLEAMRSEDPEVARRARQALEALLPEAKEPPAQLQQAQAGAPGWVVLQGAGKNGVQLWVNGIQQKQLKLQFPKAQKFVWPQQLKNQLVVPGLVVLDTATKALKKFGIEGGPAANPLKVGRNFHVAKVVAGSAAAKLGVKAGDSLLTINGRSAADANAIHRALGNDEKAWAKLNLRVLRKGMLVNLGPKPEKRRIR